MKIHIKQIPAEGLHLEGVEEGDILSLNDPAITLVNPVRYSLDVGLSNGGLFATGWLEADLQLECVRCLEKFEYTISIPDFATQVELSTAELVDLTDEVREDILLALPPYPHCDWNGENACAGLKKIEITNERNKERAPSKGEAPSDESEGRNPWKTLDQLTNLKDTIN